MFKGIQVYILTCSTDNCITVYWYNYISEICSQYISLYYWPILIYGCDH